MWSLVNINYAKEHCKYFGVEVVEMTLGNLRWIMRISGEEQLSANNI
jgi:hypothetical protein